MKASFLLSLLFLTGSGCLTPQAARAEPLDGLVHAIVYDEQITRGELVQRLLDHYGDVTRSRMVNLMLVDQAAAKHKVAVTPQEVEKRYAEIRMQFRTEADLKSFLQRNRLTEERYRQEIGNTLLLQKVAAAADPIKEEELKQYHIRVLLNSDRAAVDGWLKQLKSGVPFLKLAREENQDATLRRADGRMRPFIKIEMFDLGSAVEDQGLKVGGYTQKPVKLASGDWALIQLEGITVLNQLSATEQDRLRQLVGRYHIDQWLEQERKQAKIELQPIEGAVIARVNGQPLSREEFVRRLLAAYGEESLDLMINREILQRAAKKNGVAVSVEEANRKVKEVRARFKSEEEYQEFLTRSNLSPKQLEDEITFSTLMERVVEKEAPVTDQDLARYDVRMIVAPTQQTAEKWVAELGKGADFGQMATDRSLDPDGRKSAGRMRPFLKIELLDVWRVIDEQGLKPGDFTKKPALLTDGSWVLIKLDNLLSAASLSPQEREKLMASVRNFRTSQWLSQALQQAREAGMISKPVPVSAAVTVSAAQD